MQANQTGVVWTVILCTLVLLIVGGFISYGVNKNIALAVASIPTEAGIAGLIVVPEPAVIPEQYVTGPQVKDAKKQVAYSLALEEMEDDDFLEDVMDRINSDIPGGQRDIDDIDDITIIAKSLDEDETEVDLFGGENAWVVLEFNAYYLEDSEDDECGKARLQVKFRVEDLDRDSNYEDAEVTNRDYLTLETRHDPKDSYCSKIA